MIGVITELLLKEENFGKNGGKRHETFKADLKKLKEKLNANPQFVVSRRVCQQFVVERLITGYLHNRWL